MDRTGIPLAIRPSTANADDSTLLLPLGNAIPRVVGPWGRSCRLRMLAAALHAVKAHDSSTLHRARRARGIAARIAGRGVDAGERLGRHRSAVEHSLSCLPGPGTPNGDAVDGLDQATLFSWTVAWMPGIRAGAAIEHLGQAVSCPVSACDRCHGRGRLWFGSPFRSRGGEQTVCPARGGRGRCRRRWCACLRTDPAS